MGLGARFFKACALVLMGVAVCFHPYVAGKFLADDGHIDSIPLVRALQVTGVLVLTGAIVLWMASKRLQWHVPVQKMFGFIMAAGTIIICLVIIEGFLRWGPWAIKANYVFIEGKIYPLDGLAGPKHFTFDPVTGYALIPNISDARQKITTDEHGFRITGRPYDPQRGSIVFVGDSTVFGWGVADEQTFPYRLAQDPMLSSYNVVNMGVPSYSLGHIVSVLEHKVPQFTPRIVFVSILWPWKPFDAYSSADAWKNIDFEFYRQRIPYRQHFTDRLTPREVLTPRLLSVWYSWMYRHQIHENLSRPGIRDFNLTAPQEERLAQDHIDALKKAAQPLIAQGVEVIFYIHPYQYTVFDERYKDLGMTGRRMMIDQMKALDTGPFLKQEMKGDVLYIDGCHLTPAGHHVFVEYFQKILKNKIESLSTP